MSNGPANAGGHLGTTTSATLIGLQLIRYPEGLHCEKNNGGEGQEGEVNSSQARASPSKWSLSHSAASAFLGQPAQKDSGIRIQLYNPKSVFFFSGGARFGALFPLKCRAV